MAPKESKRVSLASKTKSAMRSPANNDNIPLESRIRHCADPQNKSPFFSKLSGELRNRIYAFALVSVEDVEKPLMTFSHRARPGERYNRKPVRFLLTCRKAYLETYRLTVYLNEHHFCFMQEPQLVEWRYRWSERSPLSTDVGKYFRGLTAQQTLDVSSLYLHVNEAWLRSPMHELQLLSQKSVKHLRLTIGVDGWDFEPAHPQAPISNPSIAAKVIHCYEWAIAAIMLAYPSDRKLPSWTNKADQLLAKAKLNLERIKELPSNQVRMVEVTAARILLKRARWCALNGFKVFHLRLPEEGFESRVLGLPPVKQLALDLRMNSAVSFRHMTTLIRAYDEGRQIDAQEKSFASYLATMPMLETFTLELDAFDFFRPRLQQVVDHAKTWIFKTGKAEKTGTEWEMRVVADTELEEWDAFSKEQIEGWEEINWVYRLERPGSVDRAITMRVTWQLVPKDHCMRRGSNSLTMG